MQAVLVYNIDPRWDAKDRGAAERESRRLGFAIRRQRRSLALSPVRDADIAAVLDRFDPDGTIILNCCEELPGTHHGETQAARTLEAMNFTFTGASSAVLELSYDKPRVKRMLRAAGVPTPDWRVFRDGRTARWSRFPAIVKPSMEHCSLGMDSRSVVQDPASLRRQVTRILDEFKQPALVEEFIDGREFHVPLWGNGELEMLPPVEMDFSRVSAIEDRVCSYAAKFFSDSEECRRIGTVVPAPLTGRERAALERVCMAAYRTVGCRDYGRIDVRLRDGVFHVLDVNPNADISSDASMAMAAQKLGMCYGALGSRLLELAAARHPQNRAPHQ